MVRVGRLVWVVVATLTLGGCERNTVHSQRPLFGRDDASPDRPASGVWATRASGCAFDPQVSMNAVSDLLGPFLLIQNFAVLLLVLANLAFAIAFALIILISAPVKQRSAVIGAEERAQVAGWMVAAMGCRGRARSELPLFRRE